ncbi:glycine betaine ABC transporter substrate-binding protein [Pontivivens insulae]|uniref:ABC-type glycine betaine transport system substrate-binding domain-containing protein n=1 Tax=Pontivivens insulae TaxID=1639689 RepID=A0A2R8A8E4_9RHOB|nr:glycine betaine ABC transporter substrate-binding protein [Pontivivens insulae]RED18517.1 glycine betaine/proline transport system substrate-binding protein [Pontivivens insulae]SPF28415.1 hypothetical protein POI8812_00714 [Pontivivens insulae]
MLRFATPILIAAAAMPAAAQDIIIGEPNWFSGTVIANVLHDIIEQRTDLEVEIAAGTNPEIFGAIASNSGAYHVHADVWMPGHAQWVEDGRENGAIALATTTYDGRIGMCTPRYTADALGLRTIEDMARSEVIAGLDPDGDGDIPYWVGGEGWQMSAVGQIKLRDYGLRDSYEPVIAGEGDYQEDLYAAFANREHVVFACYEPMSWFAMEYIEYIEEPEFGEDEYTLVLPGDSDNWLEESTIRTAEELSTVQIGYATAIADAHPEIAPFLANFGLTNDDITEFMFMIDMKGMSIELAVQDWIVLNEEKINGWFSGVETL